MKTLIIIPAYNEGACIKEVVNKIKTENVDVLVVNDGSIDNTYEEAKQTKATVINLPINLGIGGAVQTGYLYAYKNNYDIAIQLDGDGQHKPEYITEMINILEKEEVDMVIGSRFIENTGYPQTHLRMLGTIILRCIIKLFTGTKIYDPTSGYRAVNKKIIKKFALNYPYDYPEPDTELRLLLEKYKLKEIPVTMNIRSTGKSFVTPFKSIYYMVKVSFAMLICWLEKRDKNDL